MIGRGRDILARRSVLSALGLTFAGGASGLAMAARTRAVASDRRDGLAALERWIAQQVADGRITGASANVTQNGVPLWQKGFGFADKARRLRATPFTAFGLASVTKPFTTAAIAALSTEQQVDLDAPIVRSLPSGLLEPHSELNALTLRQLGSHSSGLPSFFAPAATPHHPPPPADLMRAYGNLAFPPGTLYEYSNLGYLLLGAALAHRAGTSYEEAVRRLIIAPMGLANTFFLSETPTRPDIATRYGEDGAPLALYTTATPASGELCSSAYDLGLFAAQLMGVASADRHVLSSSARANVLAPAFRSGASFTTFGWMGTAPAGEAVFVKNGGDPGVAARLILVPAQRLSIAVLTNHSDDSFVATVADELARTFVPGWTPVREDLSPPRLSTRAGSSYHGLWKGSASNDGVTIPVELRLAPESISCRLDISNWRRWSESDISYGNITGLCAGGLRNIDVGDEQKRLSFRLIDREDRLIGRVLERRASATLPYIVDLAR